MQKNGIFYLGLALVLNAVLLHSSCTKNDDPGNEPLYLNATFPKLEFKHNLYYLLDHRARSIEMIFNEEIDPNSVTGNISLSDKTGSHDANYDIETSGKVVVLFFKKEFLLHDGWKYELSLEAGIKSISGEKLKNSEIFELRTNGKHAFTHTGVKVKSNNDNNRNSIVCISDLHLGDERATNGNYCWFGKNAEALESLLDSVLHSNQIRELVIQGDLFDEWIVPYSILPFNPDSGINNSMDYFRAIAESPVNIGIFDRFKSIAGHDEIDLVYIPGNHDMKMKQEYLEELIPGVIWKGDVEGLGKYSPADGIIMEHGHRYDFFNCPQPLVNAGHMLPPGYFISRLYAQGMMESAGNAEKSLVQPDGSADFVAAWTLAIIYTLGDFNMSVPPLDSAIVLMGGIDGYIDPFSFNGAQDMYAANIQDLWPATQTENAVPVPLDVLIAIWHGFDLTSAALLEYMQMSTSLSSYNVVSFGHSHNPMVQVYPAGNEYSGIYANSGSWIDADQCSHDVRTYLVIKPAEWTDSDLDVVMLHQLNLAGGTKGNEYVAELISEENILK